MKHYFLFVCAIAIALQACCFKSTRKQSKTESQNIEQTERFDFENLNGKWNVVELDNMHISDLDNNRQPFISFDIKNMQMNASAGCNSIGGKIDRRARRVNSLAFLNVYSTKMLCHDEKLENSLIAAINATQSYEYKEQKLFLVDKDDNILATLIKAK